MSSKNRWKLAKVIFGTPEIYYFTVVIITTLGCLYYWNFPLWRASGLDKLFSPTEYVPIPIILWTFLSTMLIWNLSSMNSAAQQYSNKVKETCAQIHQKCNRIVMSMIACNVSDDLVRESAQIPELYRRSLLSSVGVTEFMAVMPLQNTSKGTLNLLHYYLNNALPYPNDLLRAFHKKIMRLPESLTDMNTRQSKILLLSEISSQSGAVCDLGSVPVVAEPEYIYPINAQTNIFGVYTLLTITPIVFISYFSWHFGVTASYIVAIIVIGQLEGIRNRNVYQELAINDLDDYDHTRQSIFTTTTTTTTTNTTTHHCAQNGIEDWGTWWIRANMSLYQEVIPSV